MIHQRLWADNSARREIDSQRSEPPVLAQYLLEHLAHAEWSKEAAGGFFERYQRKFNRVHNKHGLAAAKFDYWQVLRSVPGLLRIRFIHLLMATGIAQSVKAKLADFFQHVLASIAALFR
jgi:hypothetical protein